jgi:hypothetical protein
MEGSRNWAMIKFNYLQDSSDSPREDTLERSDTGGKEISKEVVPNP